MDYARKKAKEPHFSKLIEAETPIFLINSKLGSGGLVTTWLEEKALAFKAKEEAKQQIERRKEYQKDLLRKEKQSEYDAYIHNIIEGFSSEEKEAFESFFEEKETVLLSEKGATYKSYYLNSKLLQKTFSLECLIEFSPTPIYTFDEWFNALHPY